MMHTNAVGIVVPNLNHKQVRRLRCHLSPKEKSSNMKRFALERGSLEAGQGLEVGKWSLIKELETQAATDQTPTQAFEFPAAVARFLRIRVISNWGFKEETKLWNIEFETAEVPEHAGWTMFMKQHHESNWKANANPHNGYFGLRSWLAKDIGSLDANFLIGNSYRHDLMRSPAIEMRVTQRSSGKIGTVTWDGGEAIRGFLDIAESNGELHREVAMVRIGDGTGKTTKREVGVCKNKDGFASIYPTTGGLVFLGKKAVSPRRKPNKSCNVGPWDSQMLFGPSKSGSYNFGDSATGDFAEADYNFDFWFKQPEKVGNWVVPKHCKGGGRSAKCEHAIDGDIATIFSPDKLSGAWLAFDLGSDREVSKLAMWKPRDAGAEGIKAFTLQTGNELTAAATWSDVKQFTSQRDVGANNYEVFTGFATVGRYFRIKVKSNYGADAVKFWSIKAFSAQLPSRNGWTMFMKQHHSYDWSRLTLTPNPNPIREVKWLRPSKLTVSLTNYLAT